MASNEVAKKPRDNKNRAYLGNTQQNNPLSNPCIKEQDLALNCVTENFENKDICNAYFTNYRTCREFWNTVIRDRRLANIRPYLPRPEERDEIKAKVFAARKKQYNGS